MEQLLLILELASAGYVLTQSRPMRVILSHLAELKAPEWLQELLSCPMCLTSWIGLLLTQDPLLSAAAAAMASLLLSTVNRL